MRLRSKRGNRGTITLLWVLCIICTLFSRICFDGTQTDPSLAYSDIVFDGSTIISAEPEYSPSDIGTNGSLRSVFCAAPKGVPAQQAYVSETSSQGSTAFVPRKTAQRINPRSAISSVDGIMPSEIFSDIFLSGRPALSSVGLCEITSHTVILRYIHRQDGEKA